jgi:hypothetical protein
MRVAQTSSAKWILTAGAIAALMSAGLAFAADNGRRGSPNAAPAGCVIFPPAYVDTGFPFELLIVKDPSYPGGWAAPLVEAAATFKVRGRGESRGTVTATFTETESRYGFGVTRVTAELLAPGCEERTPCRVNTAVDAVVTATIRERLSDGSFRETLCAPATVSVNPAM